ncbi:unnamed protein product [Rotaria magnacalcarata]|uniref:long-chain-fatty-acid--CoA ligase n=1 Tax=Rotaria magnacalcarata TaxID=392030 RepID=A0A818Y2S3_9BILA|nr:unnamed protein product [Rotaria magnacalcarata]CAF3748744.1 unnamed protein product [Rotaria magnacalcarata]
MNETATTKLSYWDCDQCQRPLKHGEFRFNCTICENYDLCEQCLATLDPPHPHRLMRELAHGKEEIAEFGQNKSMANGIQTAITMYHDRYCLGVRDIDKTNPSLYADTYSWLTFELVGTRAKNFGQGLRKIIEPRRYLGICSENRAEWVITDFACIFQSIISVPMYCLFNDDELAYVIKNTQVSIVVCDIKMLSKFIRLSTECPSLDHIVCMDPISETIQNMEKKNNLCIHYMNDIETYGSTKHYEPINIDSNECMTIIYTSGSSGLPKGAMISERAYRSTFARWCSSCGTDRINFCFEPLAWVSGRDAVIRTFFDGGRTGFSSADVSRLMEDLALVRPNTFSATPAIWNKIYAEFKTALSIAIAHLPSEAIADEENRLLQQFSKLIPTRCKTIGVGGAMISSVVLAFMKRCFSHCTIYESYGITECGGVAFDNMMKNTLQFRLISVTEMGYTIDDEPFPRGELLLKTEEMFSGYINNPEETRAALTNDGFFCTGDIVELRCDSDGKLQVYVIDRKKNFFKLSQGQYVSPEFLQNIYLQSPFVEQIYIYGDLLADSITAVVVPNREYTQTFIAEYHLKNFDMINPDPHFHNAIVKDLNLLAEKHSLRKHEIPSRIIIDFEPFTPENGLLTSTGKFCRPKLVEYYGSRLKQSNTIEQRLKTIIETTTKQSLVIDEANNFFIPTGGDSLTAIRLSRRIAHDLGISVPLSILLQPNMTLQQLVTVIEDPSQISSTSYSILEQMSKDSELSLEINISKHKNSILPPSLIFVTGTTGFVGAFLLAELLLAHTSDCKFVCLVRCESSTNVMDRIRQNLLFHKIWKDDYQERIIPLQGDLEKTCFGLDNETYDSLAKQVDIIFHCGAAVNFVFPYHKLYGSNIFGTREIIRFAAHATTCIPIHYISTLSVLSSNVNKELSIDEISPDGLLNGYAQSKWVAEKLMATANRFGLPVVVYRLGSICASTETGACNRNDLHTFLFTAIMKLSYYPETIVNARLRALPVNFTAKSIVYLSRIQYDVFQQIYHVLNPNSEILYKDIIDAICRCGIQLKSVSFEEWRIELKKLSHGDSPLESIAEFLNENIDKQNCTISAEQFCDSISKLEFPSFNNLYFMKWMNFILDNIASQ